MVHPRSVYRITDTCVELLRSERFDGTMQMGDGSLFDVDSRPPGGHLWEQLLSGDNEVNQLRGLAAFWSYDIQKGLRSRDIHKRVSVDVKTRQRLEELSKSQDPWISEEAEAAAELLVQLELGWAAMNEAAKLP